MLLEMAAEAEPGRVVVGPAEGGTTAAHLLATARQVAVAFGDSGAERIGYLGLNSAAVPLALFGSALAGLPFVPLSYRATDEQLGDILARISPALVVCDDDLAVRLTAAG